MLLTGVAPLLEPTCLTFGLHQHEDVVFPDGANDVADNGAVGLVEELDADLGATTARTGAAQHLGDLGHARSLFRPGERHPRADGVRT